MPFTQLQNLSKLMLVVKAYFLALAVLFFLIAAFASFATAVYWISTGGLF